MSIDFEAHERATVVVGPRGSSPDEGFVAFVRDAGPYLSRTAYLLTGDRYRAEDLVQTTFERTYRAWQRIGDGEPRAYARRILVNLRTDTWRRSSREVVPGDEHLPVGSTPDAAGGVELRDALVRALAQLPSQQRRVVVMRHLLDMSEAQVAEELGRSVGTVKAANSRGLARLRGLVSGVDLELVDVLDVDPHGVLAQSKAALRRRRTTQGVAVGAAAVLVALFLAGPVRVPGLGTVVLPGSEWFREVTGLEQVTERRDLGRTDLEPGLVQEPQREPVDEGDPVPARLVGGEPILLDSLEVSRVEGRTLAADGSFLTVLPGEGGQTLQLAVPRDGGDTERSDLATTGEVAGLPTAVHGVARHGERVAWTEVPQGDSGSATYAVRVLDDARTGGAPRTVAEQAASDGPDPQPMLDGTWAGLTSERVAWATDLDGAVSVHVARLDDDGSADEVLAEDVLQVTTYDDEVVVATAVTIDGATRLELTSYRDDGTTEVIGQGLPYDPDQETFVTGWGLAVSDQLVAWLQDGGVHVLDRRTGQVHVVPPAADRFEAFDLDLDGRALLWVERGDDDLNEGAVLVLTDPASEAQPLEAVRQFGVYRAGIAGDHIVWTVENGDTGDATLHRARIDG